ncbi:MAG: L-threonylcarbamoyladenylate synthase [Muribaculaceae bacterium]|jgi:L-threonylcarbamoyladenylate synthase|nr:L-threonylcarbamoyladenylate synthase [Muribaculaceae bacterium]
MEEDIKKCIEVLNKGGLILYPTDTIWGIGCDATNPDAVKKVYELKRREDNKAMLVLLDSVNILDRYVRDLPEIAYDLIDVAVKPLTIIYDGGYNLAPNLLGENNSVGIRVTQEKFSQMLCKKFRRPIVSTSANISGEPSAAIFKEISKEIVDGVDYVVNYRQNDNNRNSASSIIKLGADATIKILRK